MNTEKGFSTIAGILIIITLVGGSIYLSKSNNLSKIENNSAQCSENTDCESNQVCYFKPDSSKGSCATAQDDYPTQGNQCINDNECGINGTCYYEPGGETGACTN